MSKRLKKSFMLLAVGGATMAFSLPFFGDWGSMYGCGQNADLKAFFQDAGGYTIQRISDTTFNDTIANSDYDNVVRQPVTNLFIDWWDEWVFTWFPEDPTNVPVVQ